MTKSEAIARAGSVTKLAAVLNISRTAIYKWQNDTIPDGRLWKLKQLKPRWFHKPKD